MGQAFKAGRLQPISLEHYTDIASEMIRLTPAKVVYHRVAASARRPTLLAPMWCENRWLAMTDIGRILDKQGAQGSAIDDPFVYQLPTLHNNV